MQARKLSVAAVLSVIAVLPCGAQGVGAEEVASDTGPAVVRLNFPDNVSLKTIADYVSQRLEINLLYDNQLAGRQVTIKSPVEVPADSLLVLLESVLEMNNLALVRTSVPQTFRIVMAAQLANAAVDIVEADEDAPEARPGSAVTAVFRLEHVEVDRLVALLKPFMAAATANMTAVPEHDMLIVTDYASNIQRIEKIVALLDQPMQKAEVRFVELSDVAAGEAKERLSAMLSSSSRAAGGAATVHAGVTVLADERTNRLALIGSAAEIEEAIGLVASLDVALDMTTKIYALDNVSAEQVDVVTRELIGEMKSERFFRSVVDEDANLLIATATPEIHEHIASLCTQLDKPIVEAQSPIRFYKLENAKAADVLNVLREVGDGSAMASVSVDGVSGAEGASPERVFEGPTEQSVNPGGLGEAEGDGRQDALGAVELPNAKVLADEATNTIIVVARPSIHALYERLIERLDVRRPQVLVEATVVAIDTTDGFRLGVEISSSESANGGTLLNFTQFGLSTVDPNSGALTLSPGVGFNGALIGADIADVIIRALESDSRARVVTRPSVLINDNATGSLVSEDEEPYESVNANNQVATTSFGGFATAGTNIEITPHISEGDHLKLEYSITLSSFTDERSSDAIPPSRQTNTLTSEATIPDGYTIVVGGLTRDSVTRSVDRVPFLGRIPVIEHAFSSRDTTKRQTTLFIFLRAVVLRDDKFKDLKTLSREAAEEAEVDDGLPASEPVAIH